MTNAVYNPKAKMESGCPTGKLVVVVVVAMVVAAPTLLYEPYVHPQLRTVDKPMEANPLADDGVAPATTVEVERCGDATLAARLNGRIRRGRAAPDMDARKLQKSAIRACTEAGPVPPDGCPGPPARRPAGRRSGSPAGRLAGTPTSQAAGQLAS